MSVNNMFYGRFDFRHLCPAAIPVALAFLISSTRAPAQSFTDIPISVPGVSFNTVRLADVNNDNRLDIIAGTQIYLANGAGGFTNRPTALPAIGSGGTSWGDFDNDGFLDVAVAGDLNPLRLYRKEGGTNFSLVATLGTYSYSHSVMAWGDFNNDGRLDLFFGDGDRSNVIYRNEGNDQFTNIEAGLPGLYAPVFAWSDFDSDGYLDFVLAGQGWVTLVYRNQGEGLFEIVNRNLTGVDRGNAWSGDFDNDGRPDLLLCGFNFDLNYINRIYRNEGNWVLTPLQDRFDGYNVKAGDYDNDGFLDLFSYGPPHSLYRNQGTNAFLKTGATFPASSYSGTVWGDCDNDGRLDIVISGDTGTRLLRNEGPTVNAVPAAPSSLQALFSSNHVVLSWAAAADANQTGGLTYNVRVGTTPGGFDVVSPMSDPANGFRRLPELGNAGVRLSTLLLNLPRGVYYWSVQAVDHSFAGSPFAPEQMFSATAPAISPVPDQVLFANGPALTVGFTVSDLETTAEALQLSATSSNTNLVPNTHLTLAGTGANRSLIITQSPPFLGSTTITLAVTDADGQTAVRRFVVRAGGLLPVPNPFTPFYVGAGAWGDYDRDGRLDVLLYGLDQYEHERSRLFHNEGEGQFSLVDSAFLELTGAAEPPGENAAWGDYDADGDLDLLLSGWSWRLSGTRLYRNDGLGTNNQPIFTAVVSGLPADLYGTVSFGDYDRDGDFDVLLDGSAIFANDGHGQFAPAGIPLQWSGSAHWLDVDADGWLDIAFANRALRNVAGRTFVDLGLNLPPIESAAGAWGDFDNDGRPDLIVSGLEYGTNAITRLYRNRSQGGFTDVGTGLPSVEFNHLSWVDFDNDGLLDFCLSGASSGTYLFRNNGNSSFTDVQAELPAIDFWGGSTIWADYDGDGRSDALMLSWSEAPLWRNHNWSTNQPPAAPTALASAVQNNTVTLSWTAASDSNQAAGLTYNVRVGTAPGRVDVVSPMSELGTGLRRLSRSGNAGARLDALLRGFAPGNYYWSVQTVDHSFAGSAFAPEQTFTVPDLLVITRTLFRTNGVMEVELSAAPGRAYALEASPDLQAWTALQTNTASTGSLLFNDTSTPAPAQRFYRVRHVP